MVSDRSRGTGWRSRMSLTTSRIGFGSVWPTRMSSNARSIPVLPNRRLE